MDHAQKPAETPSAQPTPIAIVENPGQTLGIVGLVLNFFGINIAGIILGVMSRNKSSKANMSTTLGTVSLVWGIIGTVCGIIAFLTIILFIVLAVASAQ